MGNRANRSAISIALRALLILHRTGYPCYHSLLVGQLKSVACAINMESHAPNNKCITSHFVNNRCNVASFIHADVRAKFCIQVAECLLGQTRPETAENSSAGPARLNL